MRTALLSHSDCLYHETPLGHPESADRLRAVLHALENEDFLYLIRVEAPLAERAHLELAHTPEHVRAIEARAPEREHEFMHIDPDTVMSHGSWTAALRAAGAVVAAVDGVMAGEYDNAFCAVRPPGHHAEPGRAMGFCLFNNAAIGALHARAKHGLKRVAVVDFDVHHGNGTQALADKDPDLFYASIHQGHIYPGTGHAYERGPSGNVVNAPVSEAMEGERWRAHFEDEILSAVDAFEPEFIIVSAGFDGHANDPLAGLMLNDDDFAWATRALARAAKTHCAGRLVSTLEGGYDLRALAKSASAHVRALMEA